MKKDIAERQDVELLVDQFYSRVNADPLLSSIFNDLAKVDWAHHLPKMYSFWSSVLLDENSYKGRPFPPHAVLPISKIHFERWLTLFRETLTENFEGPTSDLALERANNLAAIFNSKLKYLHESRASPTDLPITAPG